MSSRKYIQISVQMLVPDVNVIQASPK